MLRPTWKNTVIPAACCVLLLLAPAGVLAIQGPVHVIFDMHVDPVNNAMPAPEKVAAYRLQIENMNWVMDQVEPLGVKISFLSGGWWMELAVGEGPEGAGAETIRRLYRNGGQIGSHSHQEVRAGPLDWPDLPSSATLSQAAGSWQDNITWVDQGVLTAFGGAPPAPLEQINGVKGSHLPKTEAAYHVLMAYFGIEVRQGGAEEDYYGWYGHHIWNPFRPSADNYMAEDLEAPFVVPPQGAVIGTAGTHHGVFQDMTAPHVKRQFLQLYLNWRYRDRLGLPEKVWCWGWGSHSHNFGEGSASRTDLVEVVRWIDEHFAHRASAGGGPVMTWDTQYRTAMAYMDWESRFPGEGSFSFEALEVDWEEYPYLRPVAERMKGYGVLADLCLGAGTDGFLLEKDGERAVVLWREQGAASVDLSGVFSGVVDVLSLETGTPGAAAAAMVSVSQEPLLVTQGEPLACAALPTAAASGAGARASAPLRLASALFPFLVPALAAAARRARGGRPPRGPRAHRGQATNGRA